MSIGTDLYSTYSIMPMGTKLYSTMFNSIISLDTELDNIYLNRVFGYRAMLYLKYPIIDQEVKMC